MSFLTDLLNSASVRILPCLARYLCKKRIFLTFDICPIFAEMRGGQLPRENLENWLSEARFCNILNSRNFAKSGFVFIPSQNKECIN